MSFDLFPEEVANRVSMMPRARAPEPGVFDNFLSGTGQVAMSALAKGGRAVDLLGAVGPIVMDKISPERPEPRLTDLITGARPANPTARQDRYFKEHDDVFNRAVDYWTPKPGDVGTAAQVVGSLLGTLPMVLASPSLAVATTQLGVGEDLVRKGVDATKAGLVGAVQGAGLGLGIWMPIMGANGWQRVALGGAGFNVAQGIATRGASGAILSGTTAADEFKAFDGEQITLDVLLGAAFGGIAHLSPTQRAQGKAVWDKISEWGKALKPSEVDALATLRVAEHMNSDSLPGDHSPQDVAAHVDRMRMALDQLTRDEPVAVEDMPLPLWARVQREADAEAALKAAFDKPGFERTAEDLLTLRNGLPTPDADPLVRRAVELLKTPGFLRSKEDARFMRDIEAGRLDPANPDVKRAMAQATQEQAARTAPTPEVRLAEEGKRVDPLTAEATRFAAENPDLPIRVGTDAAGQPLTMTAREYLAHADDVVKQAKDEAGLFEIAAACMIGAA